MLGRRARCWGEASRWIGACMFGEWLGIWRTVGEGAGAGRLVLMERPREWVTPTRLAARWWCEWMGEGATGECLLGEREGKPMVVCAGEGMGERRLGEREGRLLD